MEDYLYQDLYELEDQHWWHRAKRALALETISRLKRKKILSARPKLLDLGCGTGRNLQAFAKSNEVYGLDFSKEAVRFCEKRGLKKVKQASAMETPYEDGKFEFITALDIIEHTDDQAVLKECWRILQPGGAMLITVPAYQWAWSKWDEVLHHQRRYTRASLRAVLEEQGFMIKKISYLYSFLLLPAVIVRKIKDLFYPDQYPSDFKLSNSLINVVLEKLCALERIVFWKLGIPFGTSVVAIAVKPNDEK